MPAPTPPDRIAHAPHCALTEYHHPPYRPGGALAGPADAGRHPRRSDTALCVWPARHHAAGIGALCPRRVVYAGRGLYLAARRPCPGGCVFTQLATIPPAMGGTARYSVIADSLRAVFALVRLELCRQQLVYCRRLAGCRWPALCLSAENPVVIAAATAVAAGCGGAG